ncbi:hypothetical protein KZX46_20475 [Polymorphobacter sp. PAMC 29334]|uniref:hypothetical protein n=1 Tax=Polymorphobacter sp. PAMC 29334 TaxID=2862331 RepID=UPI001C789308|nr:hypothetical protein [Polymorphobacter sp. PAMC 29334]QYE35060.1 hypothetical protein KZX46_20475 [Polymorphobacter sp. PAMC 29334]
MVPTIFGVILIAVGIALFLRASVVAMFVVVIVSSLFGGSAAFILPALGGSSVPPVNIALLFLILRIVVPGSGQSDLAGDSLRENLPLAVFVLYGFVMAFVGPRLFAGVIEVAPMRQGNGTLFATVELAPTSQNITTAVYMVGTLLCAVGGYIACRDSRGLRALVDAGVYTAWAHVVFGIMSVVGKGGAIGEILTFFRNAHYAQLDEEVGGFLRISGIQPEPSSFAIFGLVWFVFMFECWSLRVSPRRTGPIALALLLILIASTSSSAYVGLAGYGGVRLVLALGRGGGRKWIAATVVGLAAVAGLVLLASFNPGLLDSFVHIFDAVVTKKQGSSSGLQRAFWARQGWTVFLASDGLGIGPGSFRSSSIATAILGSTGVVGTVAFAVYLWRLVRPRRDDEPGLDDERARIGTAAMWAAMSFLLVASLVAAGPDPTALFAIFAGAALASRAAAASPMRANRRVQLRGAVQFEAAGERRQR